MDFENLNEPLLQLEILCFLAEFKGMDHPKAKHLFEKKVWLMGQEEPPLRNFKVKGGSAGKMRFDPLRKIYPDAELAYTNLIALLGKALIRDHESDLFE